MPIPIYVFDEKPQDFDLKSSESVKYVNSNFGEVYTSEGFRIIFLINTIKKDVDKLIEIVSGDKIDANGIDFLVTDWPFGVISNNDYMVCIKIRVLFKGIFFKKTRGNRGIAGHFFS